MRIVAIDHRKFDFGDGLPPLHLRSLKRIVLLAGPNGSGKTRLLKRIEGLDDLMIEEQGNWNRARAFVKDKSGPLYSITSAARIKYSGVGTFGALSLGIQVDQDLSVASATLAVAPFVTANLKLTDPDQINPADMLKRADQAERPGASHLPESCLAYISRSQERWWNATHPQSTTPVHEKQLHEESYEALNRLIALVLDTKLDRNADGRPTVFGQPIAKAGLSEGQRLLLLWCVGLHAQGSKLGDLILTLDEPENHLHPRAMIETVARIVDANKDGQIWIATHAVPLIAALLNRYADELSLYFIEDGKVSYAGREPERILISLMGGSPNVQALREFVDLPELFANARFAAECLAIPGIVAEANSADPQLSLIGAALSTLDAGTPTRILDFGAGAGRLVEALAAIHGETLKLCLDYVAWDNSRNAEATCRAAIKRGYDSADDRWFTDRNALFGRWNVGSFQYVVMCNVLHEIDPKDWLTVFAADSILVRTLAPTGKLVVVEDYLMPKGEYAHPYGFIVLNTEALQALFCAGVGEDEVTVREADNKFSGRIRAHLVPAHLLTRVNGESRKKALELARCNARDEIQRLRRSNQHDFRSGQAHAFWVQQFANTSLALADL